MKKDTKILLLLIALAIVMFAVLPILINLQPNDTISIYGTRIIYLFVDVIFTGVVGWLAVDFEKGSFLVPLVILAVAMLAQIFVMGAVLQVILMFYAEAAYLVFCIRRISARRKNKKKDAENPISFPKIVKKR